MVTNDWALLKLILLIQIKCNVPRVYINFHLILLPGNYTNSTVCFYFIMDLFIESIRTSSKCLP